MADALYVGDTNPASHVYVSQPGFGYVNDIGSVLNGATPVRITGMVWDPTTSKLFAVAGNSDDNIPRRLMQLDPTDGSVISVIGDLGSGKGASDITVDGSGNLWGWQAGFSPGGCLLSINKSTGAATRIGTPDSDFGGGGIVYISGVVYRIPIDEEAGDPGKIASIDLGTGALTGIVQLTSPDFFICGGAALYNGVVYVVAGSGATIYTLDMGTGIANYVEAPGNTLDSIATVPIPPAPSPPAPPSNDDWANAEEISGSSGTVDGTTTLATDDNPFGGTFNVWYKWVAPASGEVLFSTSGISTVVVFRGDSYAELELVHFGDSLFYVIAGRTYYIMVEN